MKIMVSACLTGKNCKYNGGNNLNKKVIELSAGNEVILVCPEEMGGFKTPRAPVEIAHGKVMTGDGNDVDEAFRLGAKKVLEIAEREKPELIVLQSRSPSCGVKEIYDGTFSGRLVKGQGVTAGLLIRHGFHVVDVEEL